MSGLAFSEPEQTNPPGIASTSTLKPASWRSSAASSLGIDRPQLDHRVVDRALDPPRAHDDARLVERRSGVSKKNTWRIWASSGSSPSALIAARCWAVGDGELELDRVRPAQQAHQVPELRVGQAGTNGRLAGHEVPFSWHRACPSTIR